MASSQVIFTTDNELKKKTMQKLKKEWNTLKSLLQYAMQAYVEGKIRLGIITPDDMWTPELEKMYHKRMQDFKDTTNVVSWDEFLQWLKK